MAYNREDAEVFNLNKAMAAQYDSLYSTAQRVFEKKIRVLDQEISNRAIDVANDAISKVKSKVTRRSRRKKKNSMEDLVNKMAQIILRQNKQYVGEKIAEEAIEEIEKGGEDMRRSKKQLEEEKNNQINNEIVEEPEILRRKTVKELIAPSGIEASK